MDQWNNNQEAERIATDSAKMKAVFKSLRAAGRGRLRFCFRFRFFRRTERDVRTDRCLGSFPDAVDVVSDCDALLFRVAVENCRNYGFREEVGHSGSGQ